MESGKKSPLVSDDCIYPLILLTFSALAHGLQGAVVEVMGVYHVLFLEAFGEGSGNTAVIASLNTGLFFGAG